MHEALTSWGFLRTLFLHRTNRKPRGGPPGAENSARHTAPPSPLPQALLPRVPTPLSRRLIFWPPGPERENHLALLYVSCIRFVLKAFLSPPHGSCLRVCHCSRRHPSHLDDTSGHAPLPSGIPATVSRGAKCLTPSSVPGLPMLLLFCCGSWLPIR